MSEIPEQQQWDAIRELFHDTTEAVGRATQELGQAEGRATALEVELLWAAREFNRLALVTTDGATYEAARQAATRLRRFLAAPPPPPPEPGEWLKRATA
jgi:hypothetical protein